MAGGLKKSNVKKKSDRAEKMAEEKRLEEEKELAMKQEIKRKKDHLKNSTLDTMFSLYAIGCAVLSLIFTTIGVFSVLAIILGAIGLKRNKDQKDRYYWFAAAATAIGVITLVLFVVNTALLLLK